MAKKPKRPKTSASVSAWENYDKRYSQWMHDKKKKAALIKKHRG